MNKTILIILVIALVSSLIGVGFLYNENDQAKSLLVTKDAELSQTKDKQSQAEKELSQTEKELLQSQTDLQDMQKTFAKNQASLDKLQKDFNLLNGEVSRLRTANCSKTIKTSEIQTITTNQGLVDPITKTVESLYKFSSIKTSFDTIWNNSKTAIFDIRNSDNESFKVVVSWDFKLSRIKGIYDIYGACFYLKN